MSIIVDPVLLKILQTPRFGGYDMKPLGFDQHLLVSDTYYKVIADPKTQRVPPVAYCAHADTVDAPTSAIAPTKGIVQSPRGHLSLSPESAKIFRCLGADDGAGLFVLYKMIKARVPGHYLVFNKEESGGIGVRKFVGSNEGKSIIGQLKYALEFDRGGDTDVVYSHGGTECANLAFAQYLCSEVLYNMSAFRPSDGGCYTDIATLTRASKKLQCVNISVGYIHAHTSYEILDLNHLLKLIDVMTNTGISSAISAYTGPKVKMTYWEPLRPQLGLSSSPALDVDDLEAVVGRYPMAAAALLEQLGYTSHDILEAQRAIKRGQYKDYGF